MANLCKSCENSIYCNIWGEWKCKELKQRIYPVGDIVSCKYYKKRSKDFKEPKCQCDDCLSRGEEE